MKFRSVKEVVAERADIEIHINPDTQATIMVLKYSCPDCAGYGCNSHGSTANPECYNGQVHVVLEPEHLDRNFDLETLLKIKAAIQYLYMEVTGD